MEDATKSVVLELFHFGDFTFRELASDVRRSGLYDVDKLMDRMEELYQYQAFQITPGFVRKCDGWFDEFEPQNGRAPQSEVREFLMEWFGDGFELFDMDSILAKVWKLSDQDKDGLLDR